MLSTTINALTADRRPDRQCRMGSSLVGRQQYNKKGRDMRTVSEERLEELFQYFNARGDGELAGILEELRDLRVMAVAINAKLGETPKKAEQPKVEFDKDGDWPPPLRGR